MMRQFFAQDGSQEPLLDALARQVAELSVESICRLVGSRVAEMSLFESRGYIRARSGAEIRRQTELAILRHPVATFSWAPAVVARATERIVPLAVRQLAVGVRSISAPAERRAA